MKRPFVTKTGEDLPPHSHCSGLRRQSFKPFSQETELWVNMIILVGRMDLIRPFLSNTGETLALMFIVKVCPET